MFRFSQTLQIDRPAAMVWPYLIAFEQVPLWDHGVLEVRQISPGPPAVGAEVCARRIYAGRETRLAGRIVAFEAGRAATMSLRGGPLDEALVEYAVEPIDARCSVVTYRGQGRLIRPLRFLHPILPAVGRAEARRNLARLRERIDAGIPPRSSRMPSNPDRNIGRLASLSAWLHSRAWPASPCSSSWGTPSAPGLEYWAGPRTNSSRPGRDHQVRRGSKQSPVSRLARDGKEVAPRGR